MRRARSKRGAKGQLSSQAPPDPAGREKRVITPGRNSEGGFCVLPVLVVVLVTLGIVIYYIYLNRPGEIPSAEQGPAPTTFSASVNTSEEPSMEPVAPSMQQNPRSLSENGTAQEGSEGMKALKRGDFESAVAALRYEYRISRSGESKTSLISALNSLAVERSGSGDLEGAKSLLSEATSLIGRPEGPTDEVVFVNLATVELKRGDLDSAKRALALAGTHPRAVLVKKNLLVRRAMERYSGGDAARAAEHLREALEIDPTDVRIKQDLEKIEAEAEESKGLSTKGGRRFIVKYEGGENAIAGHLISLLLEEAYLKVGRDINYYPDEKLTALLYSRERFFDVTRSPAWAGALYDGTIKLPSGGITEKTVELEKVIFHEYAHAVVHRLSGGKAPVWLNEGFAQYEEGVSPERYNASVRQIMSTGKLRLKSLEGSFMGLRADQAALAYAVSLSATHYIIKEYGVSGIRRILDGLSMGKSLEDAIYSALYISYDELERSWIKSLGR